MRLDDFILQNMNPILAQWDVFAAQQLPAATQMTPSALRDHARQILEAIAKDLGTFQTREEQTQKSLGQASVAFNAAETAAQTHAILRAKSGFNINQLAAEYRALRASVIRLWTDNCRPIDPHLQDLIRFNEAIDQALAESISFFSASTEESRNLLLGMLGHDLRSPLQTIQVTASYLTALNMGEKVSTAASRLINSGGRIKALLDDLLDYNRTKLGLGISVNPQANDISALFNDELNMIRVAHSASQIDLKLFGKLDGVWDGFRLRQLLANLVENAIKYGTPEAPIQVVVTGGKTEIIVEVKNHGSAIEAAILDRLFDPLKRGPKQENNYTPEGSLGLGLYIAREIARAHGGDIQVQSAHNLTVFTVTLLRTCSV